MSDLSLNTAQVALQCIEYFQVRATDDQNGFIIPAKRELRELIQELSAPVESANPNTDTPDDKEA